MRIRLTRGVIIGIALALLFYFYLTPQFWPAPTAELRLPQSARSIPFTITLTGN